MGHALTFEFQLKKEKPLSGGLALPHGRAAATFVEERFYLAALPSLTVGLLQLLSRNTSI